MDIHYKREIERKFVLENTTYEEAFDVLCKKNFNVWDNTQYSTDSYWTHPTVDFVRLRENSKELTVKVTDKYTIVDRIEENVHVYNTADAMRLTVLLLGPPCLTLTKKFSVFSKVYEPAPGTSYTVVLCLYEVQGDPQKRLFFEVEADNIGYVDNTIHWDIDNRFELKQETRSLFTIFYTEGR